SPETLTHDGKVLRWQAIPSPDGKWIGHYNKSQELWLYEVATRKNSRIAVSTNGGIGDLHWSPDSRWLAFNDTQNNNFGRLMLYDTRSGKSVPLTSDRYDSYSPAWSADGKWIYFLSDRHFDTSISGPWGPRQPEPFFDRQTQIFAVALKSGLRFPFQAADELQGADTGKTDGAGKAKAGEAGKAKAGEAGEKKADSTDNMVHVEIDTAGLASRLYLVPAPAGNIGDLTIAGDRLFFTVSESGTDGKTALKSLAIDPKTEGPETFLEDIRGYELSLNAKKLMIRKANTLYVMDVGAHAGDLGKTAVDLHAWGFSVNPREEWRQMFNEAWRLERDYFYDAKMHGNNWPAILAKYQPLADRVTDREELSDLLGQMVSELSALHIFVYGGERRKAPDNVEPASLGAELTRDESAGGYRIGHIFRADPDEPDSQGPLARVTGVAEGDVIESIDGTPVLSVPDYASLLRNKADQQVLLRIHPKAGTSHDVIVTPISQSDAFQLRYGEWELTRRQMV
ncbi:MAG: PDZ domain-containing protein, partial [Gemmatimonadota bacterium]